MLIPETHWKVRHFESEEYWTGWILVFFQWYTGYSFKYIEEHGLNCSAEELM